MTRSSRRSVSELDFRIAWPFFQQNIIAFQHKIIAFPKQNHRFSTQNHRFSTQILQPALGGNSKTTFICTVCLAQQFIEECKRTLKIIMFNAHICNTKFIIVY